VCSSTEETLMDSLMSLHGEVSPSPPAKPAEPVRPATKSLKSRKR
jgi:hypothetical protein